MKKMSRFLESSSKNHSFSFKKNYDKTSLKPVAKPVRIQFKNNVLCNCNQSADVWTVILL